MKLFNKTLALLISVTWPVWITPYVIVVAFVDIYEESLKYSERRKWRN
jgi:hypothetical protein